MAIRSLSNGLETTRFAFTVSKRVGNAVVRNRVRRRLRAAAWSYPVAAGFDIVIVARPETAQSDYRSLHAEMGLLLNRARLLGKPESPPAPSSQ
jgi:ribonuclease P protein component